jgi:hypothetical protein
VVYECPSHCRSVVFVLCAYWVVNPAAPDVVLPLSGRWRACLRIAVRLDKVAFERAHVCLIDLGVAFVWTRCE